MDYFDTLVMYLFRIILKPSRSKKIFILKQVYVVNLDPAVMALTFGAYMISAIRRAIRTSPHYWSFSKNIRFWPTVSFVLTLYGAL